MFNIVCYGPHIAKHFKPKAKVENSGMIFHFEAFCHQIVLDKVLKVCHT